jgi:transcriptional regulator with XRE-family HTH domain
MISIEQIKAARSLLTWSQADLARAARISLPALSNLERGAVMPRTRTIQNIQNALEGAGIEFIEGPGVRRQTEPLKVEMLEGETALKHLYDDIYETLKARGGDILVGGVAENVFLKKAAEPLFGFIRKFNKRGHIKARLLVCEGDTNFLGRPETSIYRWVEKESFGLVPYYIYQDKYAVLIWGAPLRIVITQNRSLTETYRRQFEAEWKRAKIPPKTIPYHWPL